MRFLSLQESKAFESKLRVKTNSSKRVLYNPEPSANYELAAKAIAQNFSDFAEICVIYTFCITGDGYQDGQLYNDTWTSYRTWRERHGCLKRTYEEPGHVFSKDENHALEELLRFAIFLGWDALVVAKPGRGMITLSHDDIIEIHAHKHASKLLRHLLKAGLSTAGV
ncbi:MAG: hypothetical protein H7X92_13805 [Chitinophagales bacterium]|nr:hypothetical protein [Hyphomicrobiales bacterium]